MEKSILIQSLKIDNCFGFIECDTTFKTIFLMRNLLISNLPNKMIYLQIQTMENGIDMNFE